MSDENEMTIDGVKYRAVENEDYNGCAGCAFHQPGMQDKCDGVKCNLPEREDRRDVIWVKAEEAEGDEEGRTKMKDNKDNKAKITLKPGETEYVERHEDAGRIIMVDSRRCGTAVAVLPDNGEVCDARIVPYVCRMDDGTLEVIARTNGDPIYCIDTDNAEYAAALVADGLDLHAMADAVRKAAPKGLEGEYGDLAYALDSTRELAENYDNSQN